VTTQTIHLKLRVVNTYALHDTVVTYPEADVPSTPADTGQDGDGWREWAWQHIHPLTGTGRTDGASWYDVDVLESSRPDLIPPGTSYAFGY
jgi:hypothetical protein